MKSKATPPQEQSNKWENNCSSTRRTDLQLSLSSPTIRNPHAKENSHSPVPQFAGYDKHRHFRFILTSQVQLKKEGGHAYEAGDGDNEKGSGCFAFYCGVVLGSMV